MGIIGLVFSMTNMSHQFNAKFYINTFYVDEIS